MDLDRVSVVLRPRSPWEAVDLGFALVRSWWRPLAASWCATVLPVWLAVSVALASRPWLAVLLLWWLRPLFDRVALFVLSRAFFGEQPDTRAVLRELPRLWLRGLWGALLVRRLDPARSFNLPVWQLEGLQGGERRERVRLLQQDGGAQAQWLTFACLQMDAALNLGLLGLLSMLEPHPGAFGLESLLALGDETAPGWAWAVWSALSFVAFSLIEPCYVAGGFSLYLSRRTRLEGWDVEIAFRRLTARCAALSDQLSGRRAGPAAALLLAVVLGASPLAGAAPSTAPTTPETPAEAVHAVLEQPELSTSERRKVWRPREDNGKQKESEPEPSWELPVFELGELGTVLRLAAFGLAAALAAVVLLSIVRQVRRLPAPLRGAGAERPELPATVFGLDLRPATLPADVPGAAWELWEKGERAAALGLLYRATLVCLVHRDGLPLQESWTEGDCLRAVAGRASRRHTESFSRLTRAWQAAAYAHRPPSGDEMRALCTAYRRHFGEAA
jgi:hypothetical protein